MLGKRGYSPADSASRLGNGSPTILASTCARNFEYASREGTPGKSDPRPSCAPGMRSAEGPSLPFPQLSTKSVRMAEPCGGDDSSRDADEALELDAPGLSRRDLDVKRVLGQPDELAREHAHRRGGTGG